MQIYEAGERNLLVNGGISLSLRSTYNIPSLSENMGLEVSLPMILITNVDPLLFN